MSNKVKQEQRYKREAQRSRKWFSKQTSETECSTKMNKREREKERARAHPTSGGTGGNFKTEEHYE